MQHAMDDVQITKDEQQTVFEMLSAVLWLGNITFSIIDDENHVRVDDSQGKVSCIAGVIKITSKCNNIFVHDHFDMHSDRMGL
jgi:myosin-5